METVNTRTRVRNYRRNCSYCLDAGVYPGALCGTIVRRNICKQLRVHIHCGDVLTAREMYLLNSLAEPYYFGQYVTEIDKILMQQNPPHEFACSPRSIARHLKFWKASEFKNWLLFYSLPLLLDYLPSLYLHHYALLALLQESIDSSLLNAAEIMLNDFIT